MSKEKAKINALNVTHMKNDRLAFSVSRLEGDYLKDKRFAMVKGDYDYDGRYCIYDIKTGTQVASGKTKKLALENFSDRFGEKRYQEAIKSPHIKAWVKKTKETSKKQKIALSGTHINHDRENGVYRAVCNHCGRTLSRNNNEVLLINKMMKRKGLRNTEKEGWWKPRKKKVR